MKIKYKNRFCSRCGKEFIPTASTQKYCGKECYTICHNISSLIWHKKYVAENKEECKERYKKYREKHKEKIRHRQKEYQQKNKTALAAQKHEYYLKNRKKFLTKAKIYQEENQEKITVYQKQYRREHLQDISIYRKNKRNTDVEYKLREYLRKRLWRALNGVAKASSTEKLFGCSASFLKLWLELQFKEGMSWSNWGVNGWHVDHIRPCSSFDLTLEDHQRACCHYTNLQPLWAIENLKKSDNLPETLINGSRKT